MAASPSMLIRIAANLAELRANLKEGRDQIETTTSAMTRMANSLSGDRLIQRAHNIVAAVHQIGGAAKLTEAEKARLNRTLDAALEKYRVLGQDAPKAMRDLHAATSKAAESTGTMLTKISTLAITVGTAIGTFLGNLAYDALRKFGAALVDTIKRSDEIAGVARSFDRLTRSVGLSGDEMLRTSRTATRGLITDLDLMAAANKGLLLDLPITTDSFSTMAQTAIVLGKAMRQGPEKSLNDLITALGRSSPLILDNLGITVKVGEANAAYAASIGKTVTQLDEAEKKLAFYNAAMAAAKDKVEALGGVQLTLMDQFARIRVRVQNFIDALGLAIATSPVLRDLLGELADALDDAFGDNQVSNVQSLVKWVNELALSGVSAAETLVMSARGVHAVYSALKTFVLAVSTVLGAIIGSLGQGIALILAAASKLPGIGGQFEDAAAGAQAFATKTFESTQRIAALTAEAAKGVGLQGDFQEALGATSGRLQAMRERLKAVADEAIDTGAVARRILGEDGEVPTSISEGAKKIVDSLSGLQAQKKIGEIAEAVAALGGVAALSRRQAADLASELVKLEQDGGKLPPLLQALVLQYRQLEGVQRAVAGSTADLLKGQRDVGPVLRGQAAQIQQIETAYREFAASVTQPVGPRFDLKQFEAFADQVIAATKPLGVKVRETLVGALSNLPDVILGAIQGGGDVGRAIGASLGRDLTAGIGQSVGTALSGVLGTTLGSAIGSIIPGLGTMLGGLFGSLIGGLFGGGEHAKVNDLRDELMTSLGGLEGAHAKIAATANDPRLLAAFERLYAAKRVEDYEKAVADFQKRYAELMDQFQAETAQAGTLWSQTTQQMIRDYEALGLTVEDVQQIIATQQQALASSAAGITAATAASQEEFDRLSRISLATFNTLQASGLSAVESIRLLTPSLDSLAAQLDKAGFSSNAALDELMRISGLVEANAPVLDQLGSLNELLIATSNLGGLTAEGFADIQAQGLSAFNSLIAAGFTQQEALAQIAPLLGTIAELHRDGKVAIDDETLALINQAREQGLLAGEALSTNDILMRGLQGFGDLMGQIFGVDVPRWFEQMGDEAAAAADRVQDEFDRISLPDTDGLVVPGAPGGPPSDGFQFGTPRLDFVSFGRERRVPLHGDEAVIPRGGGHQLAKEIAAAMAGGGGSVTIEQVIIKAEKLDQAYIRGEFGEDFATALRDVPDLRRKVNRGLSGGG